MSEGNSEGNETGGGDAPTPYIRGPAFRPFWQPESFRSFLKERKLQTLAVILSGTSAWFAWQNNLNQKAAAIPRIALQNISLAPSQSGSFDNVSLHVEYKNIGGNADRGVKLSIKAVRANGPSLDIADGDDGDRFLSGDIRTFDFVGKDVPGPFVALVACFNIDDPRSRSEIFGFTFSKEMKMFHLDSPSWRIVQSLKPCG